MKILVDSLPYYEEPCPFESICSDCNCPRYWDKEKVYYNNPHECELLKEVSK